MVHGLILILYLVEFLNEKWCITSIDYPSALIFAVNACNSVSNCSLVGAGGDTSGTYAASSASLAASSSAVNGTEPSAVMWCLDIMFPL